MTDNVLFLICYIPTPVILIDSRAGNVEGACALRLFHGLQDAAVLLRRRSLGLLPGILGAAHDVHQHSGDRDFCGRRRDPDTDQC